MAARSRNKRHEPGSNRKHGEALAVSEVGPRLREGGTESPAPPPRVASDGRLAVDWAKPASETTWTLVFACWVIATASTLGALFFSEVMELPPCVLCWYQRIFMFPLVPLLALGLFPFDNRVVRYALPLALGGCLISVFHLLLVAGVIPEGMKPCTQGVPCAEVQIQWLGFVSIPLLSFVAFSLISVMLVMARFRISK